MERDYVHIYIYVAFVEGLFCSQKLFVLVLCARVALWSSVTTSCSALYTMSGWPVHLLMSTKQ